jgi:hypothetical protein
LNINPTKVTQKSVTKIISVTTINLVAPKAAAENELLFNEPALANPHQRLVCYTKTNAQL